MPCTHAVPALSEVLISIDDSLRRLSWAAGPTLVQLLCNFLVGSQRGSRSYYSHWSVIGCRCRCCYRCGIGPSVGHHRNPEANP